MHKIDKNNALELSLFTMIPLEDIDGAETPPPPDDTFGIDFSQQENLDLYAHVNRSFRYIVSSESREDLFTKELKFSLPNLKKYIYVFTIGDYGGTVINVFSSDLDLSLVETEYIKSLHTGFTYITCKRYEKKDIKIALQTFVIGKELLLLDELIKE